MAGDIKLASQAVLDPVFQPKLSLTKGSMILFSGHGGKP